MPRVFFVAVAGFVSSAASVNTPINIRDIESSLFMDRSSFCLHFAQRGAKRKRVARVSNERRLDLVAFLERIVGQLAARVFQDALPGELDTFRRFLGNRLLERLVGLQIKEAGVVAVNVGEVPVLVVG